MSRPAAARPRTVLLCALALVAALLVSLAVGGRPTSPAEVVGALFAPTGTDADVTILGLRLPRTVLGLVVGACLGVAGVLAQGHTRNPVADPGLLGIYQGAALAVVAVTAAGANPPAFVLALCAFGGALVVALLVFGIARVAPGREGTLSFVLAGVAISALASSLVTAISLLDLQALDQLRFWQVGSLASRSGALASVWPLVAAGMILAAVNTRALNALALGDDAASALGQAPWRARTVGIAAIALLGGAAVALAGPIAFAGLIVPHLARRLVGPDYRWQLPAAALLGPAVVLVADTIGRVVARPGEISVTVVLAVVGAPLFVAIARSRRTVAL
ncbi:FecCD family ABC transporter permease [Microbacterium gilvum]|uniref:Iron chelate uptake ABC transporter family permease subunit n=1 Tax=Microbacterium gilvum TaxID=1336204 RepID=A0ABP8ZWK1_9MICO